MRPCHWYASLTVYLNNTQITLYPFYLHTQKKRLVFIRYWYNPADFNRFLPTGLLSTHQKYQPLCKILHKITYFKWKGISKISLYKKFNQFKKHNFAKFWPKTFCLFPKIDFFKLPLGTNRLRLVPRFTRLSLNLMRLTARWQYLYCQEISVIKLGGRRDVSLLSLHSAGWKADYIRECSLRR